MNQPSKEVRNKIKSVSMCKLVKTRALLIIGLMFFAVGQASAESSIQVSPTGTLTIKLVYPDKYLSLRGGLGFVEVDLSHGEYFRSFAGVQNINIIAWGSEKFIGVSGITIDGDLTIKTGYESDEIMLERSAIRGKLKVVSGDGDDYIDIAAVQVGESAEIFAGAGDDYLPLNYVHFSDTVRLLTGAGADIVTIAVSVIDSHANIKTGSGDDVLLSNFVDTNGTARMFTGEGEDLVSVFEGEFGRNLTLYTGADNDTFIMQRSVVYGKAILGGAAGMEDVFQYDELNEFFMSSEIYGFEAYSPIENESQF